MLLTNPAVALQRRLDSRTSVATAELDPVLKKRFLMEPFGNETNKKTPSCSREQEAAMLQPGFQLTDDIGERNLGLFLGLHVAEDSNPCLEFLVADDKRESGA